MDSRESDRAAGPLAPRPAAVGVVLAGGEGRRLVAAGGGAAGAPSKPGVLLAGRPLVAYPVGALGEVCGRVAVVCKRDTGLPSLGVERWIEPDVPRHPVTGLVYALERAGGPILVCAADMPFVTGDALRELLSAGARAPGRPVVAIAGDGELEPLLGLYPPGVREHLVAAAEDAPLRRTVEALDPSRVELSKRVVRSINAPADLARAESELAAARR